MRIIDTHLHLIYPERFSYPWLGRAPALDRPWPFDTYWTEAEPLGIEAALHMEVDVDEADSLRETEFVTTLHPRLIGAIAAAQAGRPDFPAQLEALAANLKVRGLRQVLHSKPDEFALSDLFVENIRRIADFNLTYDLCFRADQLPVATRLAQKAPQVQFILDHCGAEAMRPGGLNAWRRDLLEIARLPNVAVKISGIAAYVGPDWTTDDLRPFVEHTIAAFGWDRLVWGSDYPVLTPHGSLTRWVLATHELLQDASEDQRVKLLHGNAQRIYGIPVGSPAP